MVVLNKLLPTFVLLIAGCYAVITEDQKVQNAVDISFYQLSVSKWGSSGSDDKFKSTLAEKVTAFCNKNIPSSHLACGMEDDGAISADEIVYTDNYPANSEGGNMKLKFYVSPLLGTAIIPKTVLKEIIVESREAVKISTGYSIENVDGTHYNKFPDDMNSIMIPVAIASFLIIVIIALVLQCLSEQQEDETRKKKKQQSTQLWIKKKKEQAQQKLMMAHKVPKMTKKNGRVRPKDPEEGILADNKNEQVATTRSEACTSDESASNSNNANKTALKNSHTEPEVHRSVAVRQNVMDSEESSTEMDSTIKHNQKQSEDLLKQQASRPLSDNTYHHQAAYANGVQLRPSALLPMNNAASKDLPPLTAAPNVDIINEEKKQKRKKKDKKKKRKELLAHDNPSYNIQSEIDEDNQQQEITSENQSEVDEKPKKRRRKKLSKHLKENDTASNHSATLEHKSTGDLNNVSQNGTNGPALPPLDDSSESEKDNKQQLEQSTEL